MPRKTIRRNVNPGIDEYGIARRYRDATGKWHDIPDTTVRSLRATLGNGSTNGSHDETLPWVVARGQRLNLPTGTRIHLEEGGTVDAGGPSAPELPLGYHELESPNGNQTRRLIVTPVACHLPDDLFEWGWAVQAYALRSKENWGIGDLADLARLGTWSAGLRAGFLLISPLGADAPVVPQERSPYSAGSRSYRNLLYLRIEDVPGADSRIAEVQAGFAATQVCRESNRIDRDLIFQCKIKALRAIWKNTTPPPEFEQFESEQGAGLANFSRFCALAEKCGRNWRAWPAEYRHPDSTGVAEFAARHAAEVRFHSWVQWVIDLQLARAAGAISLMQDLPVGVSPDGADAWMYQDSIAPATSIGAPPDPFNRSGQNWCLQAFSPQRLKLANYEPFIQSLRGAMRHAKGLRIDHVMGLFRLFCIPEGAGPSDGAYVYYPADDLLGILALESHRAGCFVVGEDLGTVEPSIRKDLALRKILTCRLLWFEAGRTEDYPRYALASISSHDLPTVAGLWTGQDSLDERQAGVISDKAAWDKVRTRLKNQTGLPVGTPAAEMVLAAHRRLAAAPCCVVTASLDDALAIPHRPNMPGTVDTWPNWSVPLPITLDELEHSTLAAKIAAELQSRTKPLG